VDLTVWATPSESAWEPLAALPPFGPHATVMARTMAAAKNLDVFMYDNFLAFLSKSQNHANIAIIFRISAVAAGTFPSRRSL
jgi:hypothetical protein